MRVLLCLIAILTDVDLHQTDVVAGSPPLPPPGAARSPPREGGAPRPPPTPRPPRPRGATTVRVLLCGNGRAYPGGRRRPSPGRRRVTGAGAGGAGRDRAAASTATRPTAGGRPLPSTTGKPASPSLQLSVIHQAYLATNL